MTSLKLVIDTNVLISAALSAQGTPAKLLRWVLESHTLVFSQATFDELQSRIYRPKFDRYITLEQRQRLLHDFNASAHWIDLAPYPAYCRDPDDDKFIECALYAQVPYVVSEDKHLLNLVQYKQVRFLSAAEFLKAVDIKG